MVQSEDTRLIEDKTALDLTLASNTRNGSVQPDFVGLHNMSKHIIYLKEGAEALDLTMTHMKAFHQRILENPPQGAAAQSLTRLTHDTLNQTAVQVEVWKLRMNSLERRIQNIINLVGGPRPTTSDEAHSLTGLQSFNTVTQRDSKVLLQDSKSMRAVATVTVAFLPMATIAAVFGSEFFDYEGGLAVSPDFWIFWLIVAPCSLVVAIIYYYMCYVRSKGVDVRLEKANALSAGV